MEGAKPTEKTRTQTVMLILVWTLSTKSCFAMVGERGLELSCACTRCKHRARRPSKENSNSHWLFSPIGSSPSQQDEIKNPLC